MPKFSDLIVRRFAELEEGSIPSVASMFGPSVANAWKSRVSVISAAREAFRDQVADAIETADQS